MRWFKSPVRFSLLLMCGALTVGSLSLSTAAAQASDGWWLCPHNWPYHVSMCCPDDYHPKPLPCPPCSVCCFGCDDYCGKPLPCTNPVCCAGCDDYCGKPLPVISPCYTPPGATCGPPACATSACADSAKSSCATTSQP